MSMLTIPVSVFITILMMPIRITTHQHDSHDHADNHAHPHYDHANPMLITLAIMMSMLTVLMLTTSMTTLIKIVGMDYEHIIILTAVLTTLLTKHA
jgi:hypothetical protein